MKKLIIIIAIFCVCFSCLFAGQKTYTQDTYEYVTLKALSRMSGVSIPDFTFPASGDMMLEALSLINVSNLSEDEYSLYQELYSVLTEPEVLYASDNFGINAGVSLLPFYVYGNVSDDRFKSLDFMDRENNRPHLYDLYAELFVTPYFYGKFNINGTKIIGEEDTFLDDKMRAITLFSLKEMSQDWPDTAFASIGTRHFNFVIGRDRVSAGSGVKGNMSLSANRQFDDFAKFTAYKNPFSYDFTLLFYDGFSTVTETDLKLRYNDYDGPRKMILIHRLSAVLFRKVTISAFEGVVLYGSSILSDFRALNPFMLFHNSGTYYAGNTNNFAGLELTFALPKKLSLNLQAIIDQFQLSDESDDSGKTQLGILANLTHSTLFKGGILHSFVEAAYTTDGMYLKEKDNTKNGFNKNGNTFYFAEIDMVTGNKRYANHEKDEYAYLGHPNGPSAFSLSTGAAYSFKNYNFSAEISVLSKGSYGIGVNEERILDNEISSLFDNKQTVLSFVTSAGGKFYNGAVEGRIGLGIFNYKNYEHLADNENTQIQVSLFCKVHPLEFFAKRKTLEINN